MSAWLWHPCFLLCTIWREIFKRGKKEEERNYGGNTSRRVKTVGSGTLCGAFLPPDFGLIPCVHCHEEPEKPNKYHSQLPVSSKRPLIPLQFAHHSLQSQCWSFLSPVPPVSCRRFCNTFLALLPASGATYYAIPAPAIRVGECTHMHTHPSLLIPFPQLGCSF